MMALARAAAASTWSSASVMSASVVAVMIAAALARMTSARSRTLSDFIPAQYQ